MDSSVVVMGERDVAQAVVLIQALSDVRDEMVARMTCASLAIRSGANVKVVQKLLGHKTATLMLDRYGHLYPDDLEAVATAFDAAAQTTADGLRTAPTLKVVVSAGETV